MNLALQNLSLTRIPNRCKIFANNVFVDALFLIFGELKMKVILDLVKTICEDFAGIFVNLDNKPLGLNLSEPKIVLPEDELTEMMPFSLEPIQEFLEDFIGLAIIEFKSYNDNVGDLTSDVKGKIIAKIIPSSGFLWVKLSKLNGVDGGYLKVKPNIVGEFASMDFEDEVVDRTLYRIVFFGGACLEYLDHNTEGVISFQEKMV
jgi:hypothetical protein